MCKHPDLQMFGFTSTNMSNFHPLEVVGRDSESQLKVGENLYLSASRVNPSHCPKPFSYTCVRTDITKLHTYLLNQ